MLDKLTTTTAGAPALNAVLVVLLLGPLLMAAVAAVIGRRRSRLAGRLGAGAAALGFLGARSGRRRSSATGLGDRLDAGGTADRLAVVLLLLVYGVSAIVQTTRSGTSPRMTGPAGSAPAPAC
ncbi:MAG: hypothetical protein H6522_06605 [Mycolicibacterium sp.]|nr:hypothetical protein [Mycolicibacterium sp.]